MREPFDFGQFFAPPRDMTPTITAFVRALLPLDPRPDTWFVDAITLAILRDEGKMIGQGLHGNEIVSICGVRIIEFDQPT